MWLIYNMVTDYFYNKINDTDTDTDTDLNNLIDIGTQTSFTSLATSSLDEMNFDNNNNNNFFKHLAFANQSYFEHFSDSIKYCGTSLKGAFYFFCHAFWPDIFQQNGSETIHQLSSTIHDKYQKRMAELASN